MLSWACGSATRHCCRSDFDILDGMRKATGHVFGTCEVSMQAMMHNNDGFPINIRVRRCTLGVLRTGDFEHEGR